MTHIACATPITMLERKRVPEKYINECARAWKCAS